MLSAALAVDPRGSAAGDRTFLVVDDDEAIGLYLNTVLADRGRCDRAVEGESALEMFRNGLATRPYDAVFMDIMLPRMDGHRIVETMRRLERQAGIPAHRSFALIMITALDDTHNVARAYFRNQASGYLVKPFTRERILEELHRAGLGD